MLDDTLVVWGTEFGRAPHNTSGRDHWPDVFSCWLAGGGIKGGMVHGASDPFGFAPASAEEAAPVVCVEPQVLDTDGLTCVDPVVEEVVDLPWNDPVAPAPVQQPAVEPVLETVSDNLPPLRMAPLPSVLANRPHGRLSHSHCPAVR